MGNSGFISRLTWRRCALALVVLGLVGCGNSVQGNWDGSGPDGVDGGCDPATLCGPAGFECGVHFSMSCGGEVDCGRCRWTKEDIPMADITTGPSGDIHLAWFGAQTLEHATVVGGFLEVEQVTMGPSGNTIAIGVAPDGTIHIVALLGGLKHAMKTPGTTDWSVNDIPEFTDVEALSVIFDVAGEVQIFVTGLNPNTRLPRIQQVTVDGGMYEVATIEGVSPVGYPAFGLTPDKTIILATGFGIREFGIWEMVDGVFTRVESAPEITDLIGGVSIASTTDAVHIAVHTGERTLWTGSELLILSRTDDRWSTVKVVRGVDQEMAIAAGPEDGIHIVYFGGGDGLFYTRRDSSVVTDLAAACDNGKVRLAVDCDDQPHIVYQCSGAVYIAPLERYSDEYIESCEEGASTICSGACNCADPDCCYGRDPNFGDAYSCLFGPGDTALHLCLEEARRDLCGSITAEPQPLIDCVPTLEAAPICADNRYVVSEECYAVIQANRF